MRNIFKKRSKDAAQQQDPSDSAIAPQPQMTPLAENHILVNRDGLLVTPVLRPSRFASPDLNVESFEKHFMESMARQGAVSKCVVDELVTPLPAPTRYSRWVETNFFLSPIEELVIATDPSARYRRLNRLRKYYTNPIAKLSKKNVRRAAALRDQMIELRWLMEKTGDLPDPPWRSGSLPSLSTLSAQPGTELEESDIASPLPDIARPLPHIAQMANEDVSISEYAVYNRAIDRYLAESPTLSATERSSMEDLRSSRDRQRLAASSRLSRIPEGSERSSATKRVSHKRASRYMEEIDVRPERRDPHRFNAGGVSSIM